MVKMYRTFKGNKQKKALKNQFLVGIFKVTGEKEHDPDPDPDPREKRRSIKFGL
jgi:hypothetical protein